MAPCDLTGLIRCQQVEHFDLWMLNNLSCLALHMECICVETPPPQTKQNKHKKTVPLRSTVQTPTLFFDSIQIDAPQFFFFFLSQDIHHISAGLTDQSQRTHWRRYLLYLFMKLPSSHQAWAGGWMLSSARAHGDVGGAKRLFTPHC